MSWKLSDIEQVVRERTRWWEQHGAEVVQCRTCPRCCVIHEGKAGFCGVRRNVEGRLVGLGYGWPTGFAVDPVEKKPLHHFLPGTKILSFGTVGCNLACKFCQNWHMSHSRDVSLRQRFVPPEEVVRLAREAGCPSIAFTYNDPTIFAEYAVDIARAAREQGIRCVAVTAGYIEPEPRAELFAELAAANIDLKAFSDDFYHGWCRARLQPVLETIRWVHEHTDCWIELTNLVITGLNDGEAQLRALVDWVGEALGPDVPLHFSAFHPAGKVLDRPRTPQATLAAARELAWQAGLRHVYLGNVVDAEGWTTRCPQCLTVLVRRSWYEVEPLLGEDGRCPRCGATVAGVWK
ncbi:MAG: AmmeMemoRadiSam system radical SAM enzyme [Deltaproteobacteria bacterium]|nr:AmmeMemoRadiSam system radical SAM enzyme [Deltaproteobacteria bacterium]